MKLALTLYVALSNKPTPDLVGMLKSNNRLHQTGERHIWRLLPLWKVKYVVLHSVICICFESSLSENDIKLSHFNIIAISLPQSIQDG